MKKISYRSGTTIPVSSIALLSQWYDQGTVQVSPCTHGPFPAWNGKTGQDSENVSMDGVKNEPAPIIHLQENKGFSTRIQF